MNTLITRAITGILFVWILLAGLFWRSEAAAVVFGAFMVLAINEFYILSNNHERISIHPIKGIIMGLALYGLYIAALYYDLPGVMLALALPIVLTGLLIELWRKAEAPLLNAAISIFCMVYIVVPFIILTDMAREWINGFPVVAGLFILVWTNDTFAYLTGRAIGRTKLFMRISPNKTWEGTIGGVIFAVGAGILIGYFTEHLVYWVGAAIIIAPCAVLGDLIESMYKRSLNLKDTGTLLPGHGGILDRFDATLFAVPFFLAWNSVYVAYIAPLL